MSLPSTSTVAAAAETPLVEPTEGDLVAIDDAALPPGQTAPGESATPDVATGQPSKRNAPDATFHWVMLVMCSVVVLLAMAMSVREGRQVLVPLLGAPLPELCHMKRWTGFDCPGCGMTRAFISIGHGQLAQAWRYNAGALLLFPIMLFQIPYRAGQLWRLKRGLPEWQTGWVGRCAMITLAVVIFGQWILKQLEIGF